MAIFMMSPFHVYAADQIAPAQSLETGAEAGGTVDENSEKLSDFVREKVKRGQAAEVMHLFSVPFYQNLSLDEKFVVTNLVSHQLKKLKSADRAVSRLISDQATILAEAKEQRRQIYARHTAMITPMKPTLTTPAPTFREFLNLEKSAEEEQSSALRIENRNLQKSAEEEQSSALRIENRNVPHLEQLYSDPQALPQYEGGLGGEPSLTQSLPLENKQGGEVKTDFKSQLSAQTVDLYRATFPSAAKDGHLTPATEAAEYAALKTPAHFLRFKRLSPEEQKEYIALVQLSMSAALDKIKKGKDFFGKATRAVTGAVDGLIANQDLLMQFWRYGSRVHGESSLAFPVQTDIGTEIKTYMNNHLNNIDHAAAFESIARKGSTANKAFHSLSPQAKHMISGFLEDSVDKVLSSQISRAFAAVYGEQGILKQAVDSFKMQHVSAIVGAFPPPAVVSYDQATADARVAQMGQYKTMSELEKEAYKEEVTRMVLDHTAHMQAIHENLATHTATMRGYIDALGEGILRSQEHQRSHGALNRIQEIHDAAGKAIRGNISHEDMKTHLARMQELHALTATLPDGPAKQGLHQQNIALHQALEHHTVLIEHLNHVHGQ